MKITFKPMCPHCEAVHEITRELPDNTLYAELLKCQPSSIVADEMQRLGCGATFPVGAQSEVTIKPSELKMFPDYGDTFTIEEFTKHCEAGGFINYDGNGYFATENMESAIPVNCQAFAEGNVKSFGFTHIRWYNR